MFECCCAATVVPGTDCTVLYITSNKGDKGITRIKKYPMILQYLNYHNYNISISLLLYQGTWYLVLGITVLVFDLNYHPLSSRTRVTTA